MVGSGAPGSGSGLAALFLTRKPVDLFIYFVSKMLLISYKWVQLERFCLEKWI